MSSRAAIAVAFIGLVSTSCETPSAPASLPQAAIRSNFINGPGNLPQILRFEARVIAGWTDPVRNMGIIIGAPLDPTTSRICGGTVRNQFMPVQFVGDIAAIKELIQQPDANILVYDEITPTLAESLCGLEPAAWGTGMYLRSDNDFFGTGGNRTNGFSEHVEAPVELATGGFGRVTATLHGVGRDNALVFIDTSIILTPTGQ